MRNSIIKLSALILCGLLSLAAAQTTQSSGDEISIPQFGVTIAPPSGWQRDFERGDRTVFQFGRIGGKRGIILLECLNTAGNKPEMIVAQLARNARMNSTKGVKLGAADATEFSPSMPKPFSGSLMLTAVNEPTIEAVLVRQSLVVGRIAAVGDQAMVLSLVGDGSLRPEFEKFAAAIKFGEMEPAFRSLSKTRTPFVALPRIGVRLTFPEPIREAVSLPEGFASKELTRFFQVVDRKSNQIEVQISMISATGTAKDLYSIERAATEQLKVRMADPNLKVRWLQYKGPGGTEAGCSDIFAGRRVANGNEVRDQMVVVLGPNGNYAFVTVSISCPETERIAAYSAAVDAMAKTVAAVE